MLIIDNQQNVLILKLHFFISLVGRSSGQKLKEKLTKNYTKNFVGSDSIKPSKGYCCERKAQKLISGNKVLLIFTFLLVFSYKHPWGDF